MKLPRFAKKSVAAAVCVSLLLGTVQEAVAQARAGGSVQTAAAGARAAGSAVSMRLEGLSAPAALVPMSFSSLAPASAPGGLRAAALSAAAAAPVIAAIPNPAAPAIAAAVPAVSVASARPAQEAGVPARASLSGLAAALRSDEPAPRVSAEASPETGRRFFDRAGPASRTVSWAAAAIFGLALAVSPGAAPRPGSGLLPAAPAQIQLVRDAAPPAPAQAAAAQTPPLETTIKLDRTSYEPGDSIVVTLTIANRSSQSALFPAEGAQKLLEKGLNGAYEIVSGPAGDVWVPAGQSVKVAYELQLTSLPETLERGGSVKFDFTGAQLENQGVVFDLPAFGLELRSSLAKDSQPRLQETNAWPSPWRLYFKALMGWLTAIVAAVSFRAHRKWLRMLGPEAPPMAPVPDPAAVVTERLAALREDLRKGGDARGLYVSMIILLEYFYGAALSLDDLPRLREAATLTDAALTLRALNTRLTPLLTAQEKARTLEVLSRIQKSVEQTLYEEKTPSPETLAGDLEAVERLIEARLASMAAPTGDLVSRGKRYHLSITPANTVNDGRADPLMTRIRLYPSLMTPDTRAASAAAVRQIRLVVPGVAGMLAAKSEKVDGYAHEFRFAVSNGPFWVVLPGGRFYWPGSAKAKAAVKPAAPSQALGMIGLGVLSSGAGLTNPLALLALIPLAAWLLWRWHGRSKPQPAFAAPADWASAPKSRRQKLALLSMPLRVLGLALAVLSLSGPTLGLREPPPPNYRERPRVVDTGTRSVDTEIVIDRSGSMGGDKLVEAQKAAVELIKRQERTDNRVSLITFHSESRVVMNLTRDSDALKAAVASISTNDSWGTDLDKGLSAALEHFIEMNLLDLAAARFPGAESVREVLRTAGLAAALEAAEKHPSLHRELLAQSRDRVVVFLTDGEGGDPTKAIERASLLGVRIFAVGVGYGVNEKFLRMMADKTDGRYFAVSNPAALTDIFLEIERLKNRMPVSVVAPDVPQAQERDRDAAALAWAALLLSLLLQASPAAPGARQARRQKEKAQGRSKAMGFMMIAALSGAMPAANVPNFAPGAPAATAAAASPLAAQKPGFLDGFSLWDLAPYKPIPEIREGNDLYGKQKYDEALGRYIEAQRLYPNAAEAPFARGMTERKLGKLDEAALSLALARDLAAEQGRADLVSAIENQLGLLAVDRGDATAALDHFRLANKPPSGDRREDANWGRMRGMARRNFEEVLRLVAQAAKEAQAEKDAQKQEPPPDAKPQDQPQDGQPQDGKPQDGQPQDAKPGEGKPGEGKPGEQPQDGQPQDAKPGKGKPGDGQPQDGQPQEGKPGEGELSPEQKKAQEGLERLKNALKGEPSEDPQKGGGGAPQKTPIGRAWGFAPILALSQGPFLWTNPIFFYLTGLAAVGLAVLAGRALWRHYKAARALSPNKPAGFFSWKPLRRALVQRVMALAALVLLGIGAAGPAVTTRDEAVSFGGKAIVFGQDISRSFTWAADGRYQIAMKGLDRFSYWINNENSGDRAVIIPFAGEAGEAALSRDHKNLQFQMFHMGQDGRSLREGSNLYELIQRAAQVFEAAEVKRADRVLIIMSDGGDDSRYAIENALVVAVEHGIRIYTLGVGSDRPVAMPVPAELIEEVGSPYVMDGGRQATTKLEASTLRTLAENTGGRYQRVRDEKDVERVLYQIAHTEKVKTEGWNTNSAARRFVLPGALLLALSFLLGRRRSPADPEPESASSAAGSDRMAAILRAAARIRFDKILRGEFQSLDVAQSGIDPDDNVPYTNQPARSVDYRASARTGALQAKRYEDEPDIPVWLAVDMSGSGALGSDGVSKRQAAADAAAAIAIAAAREDLPIGLMAFTDRQEKVLPPKRGAAHAREIARVLTTLEPAGRGTDLAAALEATLGRMRRRGVIVVLSDFQATGYEARLTAAGNRHILVPVVIRDPLETRAPQDLGPVVTENGETGSVTVIDTSSRDVRRHIEKNVKERDARLDGVLKAARARPIYLTAEKGYLDRLAKHLANGDKR